MNHDDVIRIAREVWGDKSDKPWSQSAVLHLERFAALLEAKVRADEREACAHMVEDWDLECFNYLACPRVVADAIRARGEK